MPPEWVQAFFETMQQLDVLKRFTKDIKTVSVASTTQISAGDPLPPAIDKLRMQYLLPDSEVNSESQWTGPVLRVLEILLTSLTSSSNTGNIYPAIIPDSPRNY